MTCQHCQTWIGQQEHRCPRCARRVDAVRARISPSTYPVAATATAPAYDFEEDDAPGLPPVDVVSPQRDIKAPQPAQAATAQQVLFTQPVNEPRVVAFDSLLRPADRESIRTRASEVSRPAPLKAERVELPRPRKTKQSRGKNSPNSDQRSLEFFGRTETVTPPKPSIICDAPVAPPSIRFRAALIDSSFIGLGCMAVVAFLHFAGGSLVPDKHTLPFLAAALLTVPLFYKLLWTFAGQDTYGMQKTGLQLVDFDGNPPSKERRYQRLFGGILSVLAAGMGLFWSFVDEDTLTWHDHISNTFPTFSSEE